MATVKNSATVRRDLKSIEVAVGCKERGGALPTVTALTAQGMTIMRLFVVQVIVSTSHGTLNTVSINKQTSY